ncbi:MAG: HEAT repeat domain-containing protein [Prochloron sp. SP5CPC1]|nr:HEAT repeat domain-containing protein [Candidatus Paraprochloron terpiosi SP5CPC1]
MVKELQPSHSISPEERERFPVLEELQKYPGEQVLLVGRPGSGKSTTLKRLLWEKAKGEGEIPVLVELRSYQNSTLDCIRRFFAHHGLELSEAEIEDLLEKKKLFLLFDGLNELPSKEAREEISQFRQQYSQLSAIFTTRELSAGGDLGLQKRLEMEPLTEEQIKEFVSAYLPETGDELLQKLDPRLADICQTPLFLWILCQVFKELKEVPENAGMLLRYFALQQDKLKKDVKVEKKLRDRAPQLLQALAVAMMKGERKEDLRLEIPLREAKNVLDKNLKQLGIKKRANRSKKWLQNLLSYHLIQLKKDGTRELVQFRHQLIQEYYAAEWLKSQLDNLKDDFLQHHYLNYVKWTEAIALMLNLSKDRDREQILRVVKLALEVDLQLGARLAGEVQKQFQGKTVELVWACEVPLLVKIELLKKTKSEKAGRAVARIRCTHRIGFLSQALSHSDNRVRSSAVYAQGQIGSERAVEPLITALNDSDVWVRIRAAYALGKIGDDRAAEPLINALKDSNVSVRCRAAGAQGQIGDDRAVELLINALIDPYNWIDSDSYVAEALGKIAYPELLPRLIEFIPTTAGIYILDIITAIQKRCNYYNYQIFHSKSPRTFPKTYPVRRHLY